MSRLIEFLHAWLVKVLFARLIPEETEPLQYLERPPLSESVWRKPERRLQLGTEHTLQVVGFKSLAPVPVSVRLLRAAGGGFAGQVYQCELIEECQIDGETFDPGFLFALKIMTPKSGAKAAFRDLLYKIAFGAPFSLQYSWNGIRHAALFQKLFRRAAREEFGDEDAIVDVFGTCHIASMASYAHLNQWIEGRVWLFGEDSTGRSEQDLWREFLTRLVKLFHRMGAIELARQYEWWTGKCQPNALLQKGKPFPTAIDFCAGLALVFPLCLLDIKLIWRGYWDRGKRAQFDTCDLATLESFVAARKDLFEGTEHLLQELRTVSTDYYLGRPDRLNFPTRIFQKQLFNIAERSEVSRCWKMAQLLDAGSALCTATSASRFAIYYMLWWVPVFGSRIIRFMSRTDYRLHCRRMVNSIGYAAGLLRNARVERITEWYFKERISRNHALRLFESPPLYLVELALLSWFPGTVHRLFTDPMKIQRIFSKRVVHPLLLTLSREHRANWMRQRAEAAAKLGLITAADQREIENNSGNPLLDRYISGIGEHLLVTLFTKGLVLLFFYLCWERFGETPAEAKRKVALTVAAVMVFSPVSPDSFARFLYVVGIMIKRREFRTFWVAAVVGGAHMIGYAGFAAQMAFRFPLESRAILGLWIVESAEHIPVFGERGALLEYGLYWTWFHVPRRVSQNIARLVEGASRKIDQCTAPIGRTIESALEILDRFWGA